MTINRPRQHRFAEPTRDVPDRLAKDPVTKYDPRKYDPPPKGPTVLDIWRKASVYEKVAWLLAIVGCVLIPWLVVRGVP